MSRYLFSLFFALLLLCGQAYAAVIDKVSFIGDDGEEVSIQVEGLQTKTGIDLDPAVIISDINTLKNKLPQYQNIIINVNPIDGNSDSIEVIFEFQKKRVIKSIRILAEGDLKIPLDLREKLRLQRQGTFDSADLLTDKKTIQQYYINEGYAQVEVSHELLNYGNNEEVELTLTIKPNTNQMVVRKLKFKGNDSFEKRELKKIFEMKPRAFFLFRHTVFKLNQLEEDIQSLTQFYRNAGFLDAVIDYKYSYELTGQVKITVTIEEGRQYQVKEIEIEHNQIYADDDIRKVYDFDSIENYNDKQLRSALQKVREFYGNHGHAQVQAYSGYDSANEILKLKIVEGPIFDVTEIKVEGNESMDAETVLLDVDLQENERFNAEQIEKSIKSLKNTGYYSNVQVDFEPTSTEEGSAAGKVIITVEEARTRTLSFGAGTGTSGIVGELSYGDNNLGGTGNSLSLQLKKMAELTKIGLVYRDAHLMDSDYSMSLAASYTAEESSAYDEEKISATLMIQKQLTENLKMGVGTRIEFLNLSDINEEIKLSDYNADGEDKVLGMVGTLLYKSQTKDTAGDVKEGVTIHMALLPSYADQGAYIKAYTTLMGTTSLYENEDGVSHSLTGRLTVGYASDNAPFFEKFYAGGTGTLRGFENKSVSTEEGTGGNILISGSTAYSFPLWEETVKGVLFLEAASVGDSLDDLGNIRAVGGIGVKANLMDTFLGSMIEAGVAIPLRKQEGDSLKPFYFIFGDYDPAYDL